ncbi:MAG: hypothetical protein LBL87_04615 [Ruminococcus sp.]|jgi:hypothetical protein|nr:hypothetical protein [Ruminococcus sp.]
MKYKKSFALSLMTIIGILCSGCSAEPPEQNADSKELITTQTNNVLINSNAGQMPQTKTAIYGVFGDISGNSAGYMFEFGSFGDNYVITAAANDDGTVVNFTVEDNDYNSTVYALPAPVGYFAEQITDKNCIVIKAPRGSTDVPDILQINFASLQGESAASLFYSIKARELVPIGLYTTIPYTLSEMSVCSDTVLIRTEDYKFMPPPVSEWDENGFPVFSVFTYTFDPNRMTLTKAAEAITPDNQLYYSYAVLGASQDIISMYTTKNLTTQSDTDFVSVQNTETGESEHYFKINDPRFSSTSELLAFTNRYFSPEITDVLFTSAPQKYRDIDGSLYAVKVTGQTPRAFPVITDVLREDTDISVQLSGGGNIVIRPIDGNLFTIEKYTVV